MTTHREQAVDDLYERVAAILCQHVADTATHEATAEAIDDWHGVTARTIVRIVRATPIVGPDMGTERPEWERPYFADGSSLADSPQGVHRDTVMRMKQRARHAAEPMSSEVANNETALDVDRLARAIYEAQRPEGWPTWEEYLDSFAHPRTQQDVWLTRAAKVAAEYDRLAVRDDEEPRT